MSKAIGYGDALKFLKNYNPITYPEFDYYSFHRLNLFSSFEDVDLEEIERHLASIEAVLPAIKRIFARPIIRLIDEDEILPVEAVKRIGAKTLSYASSHPELAEDVTPSGIKPRKLLSSNYKDNYLIYENVVFVHCVNAILNYCRRTSSTLKNLIYTHKKLEIDLLERENHFSYYLALGKLETGHIRSFAKYIDYCLSLISRLDFITATLKARLKRPIYVKCNKAKGNLKLKKTNILAMHKDYRKIYRYMKDNCDKGEQKEKRSSKGYLHFCKYLTVFAAGHFNFEPSRGEEMDFSRLNASFSFKEYRLRIKDAFVDGREAIALIFKHDIEYKMFLLPSLDKDIDLKGKEECYLLSDDYETNGIYISMSSLDSFRRIQQLLLKGMIYSSKKLVSCPFCGEPLKEEDGVYSCSSCRQLIKKEVCPETNKPYFSSSIAHFVVPKESKTMRSREEEEALLHYRNITPINKKGEPICPHCHKVHSEED